MAIITRFLLGSLNGILGPVKAYAIELFREDQQAIGLSTVSVLNYSVIYYLFLMYCIFILILSVIWFQVSAAWAVGLIIGPALGGYLAQVLFLFCVIYQIQVLEFGTFYCTISICF